jgi:hypothetical protein
VKFIPNDSRSAQVIVANRTERPLSLRLPAGFAGTPILAQVQQQGQGFAGANQPQNVGGGGNGNQQGNCWVAREIYGIHDHRWVAFRSWLEVKAPWWLQCAYAMHGEDTAEWLRTRPLAKFCVKTLMDEVLEHGRAVEMAAGQMTISPEDVSLRFEVLPARSRVVRVTTVCLEHGKREPSARIAYKMVSLEDCSGDRRVAEVLYAMAKGEISQKVAQAAVWHLSSGRTWGQLGTEVHAMDGVEPDVPVFSEAELATAQRFVEESTKRHAVATESSSGG